MFGTMPYETFIAALKPKVSGSRNLHAILPRGLDFFVLLSSAAGIGGVRGQSNYACGNTYQDALARHRVWKGEKATSLDLGVILSSGYVAERPQVLQAMKGLGFLPLEEWEMLALLDYHCNPALDRLSASTCQVITGLDTPASMRAQGMEEAYWMAKCQFRGLHLLDNSSAASLSSNQSTVDVGVRLSGVESLAAAADLIVEALLVKLARVLSMPQEDIDPSKPMHRCGVDSLVALEVRHWFSKEVVVDVPVLEILGNESIMDVCLGAARRSPSVKSETGGI